MTLRSALLALLSSGPLTGYDLVKQFSSSVGHVWHAPDSQIYPELRRMHAEGLLSSRPVPWGTRGATKTEYALTPAGEAALIEWQNQPLTYVRDRDPARLRAAYFEWAPSGVAAAQLRAHIAHYDEQRLQTLHMIQALEQRTHPTLARRLTRYSEEEREHIVRFKVFAYEGQLAHAEQEIAWAKRGLQILEDMEKSGTTDPVTGMLPAGNGS
ncbi:PadR family transcriptional regulator [Paenarthrobacter sp.]|uniref:PadR family transcriptional regulator n=1 Tax=Paenarthrobacter sp. TaxID=1931993 RepID=UPI002811F17E|nr:PadR family transcriptional regulator [Paenarthrobacter sp.]